MKRITKNAQDSMNFNEADTKMFHLTKYYKDCTHAISKEITSVKIFESRL